MYNESTIKKYIYKRKLICLNLCVNPLLSLEGPNDIKKMKWYATFDNLLV